MLTNETLTMGREVHHVLIGLLRTEVHHLGRVCAGLSYLMTADVSKSILMVFSNIASHRQEVHHTSVVLHLFESTHGIFRMSFLARHH